MQMPPSAAIKMQMPPSAAIPPPSPHMHIQSCIIQFYTTFSWTPPPPNATVTVTVTLAVTLILHELITSTHSAAK
eukprot:350528-Chlamydomonas_euryale.AAC.1